MNFDFSQEQKELQQQAAGLLSRHGPLSEAHRILNSEDTHSAPLWNTLIEAGWTATALPERHGGFGMGYLELCVLARELGRVCAPVPFSSAVYLAGEALVTAGTEEQKSTYLGGLADGSLLGTLATGEQAAGDSIDCVSCRVRDGRLQGRKIAVPDALSAQYAVVSARQLDHHALFLVHLDDPGVQRKAVDCLDNSRSLAEVRFNDVPAEPLGAAGAAPELLDRIKRRAAVLFAFEQLGGAEGALEMARVYACDRHAFGRAIGSFQSIKHRLADLYVTLEIARSNCYHGAYALSSGALDLPVAAAAAHLAAGKAFTGCARENIQVHGGAGFTWEGDCQLFYRRARWLSLALGGERRWKQRLVASLRTAREPLGQRAEAVNGL